MARVRREAEAMGRLGDHPNIVTVHDVDDEKGRVYLVCQYIAGGDLDHELAAADELLISGDVRQKVEGAGNLRFADERVVTLKGISGEHRLIAVDWR